MARPSASSRCGGACGPVPLSCRNCRAGCVSLVATAAVLAVCAAGVSAQQPLPAGARLGGARPTGYASYELSETLPAPYNLVTIASDGAVCLRWERPRAYTYGWGGRFQQPVVSYSVMVEPEGFPQGRLKRFFVVPTDVPTESKITGLQNGYTYNFRVQAEGTETGQASEASIAVRATPRRGFPPCGRCEPKWENETRACSSCCGDGTIAQSDGCGSTRRVSCSGDTCCCSPHWRPASQCSSCCGPGIQSETDGCGNSRTAPCRGDSCCCVAAWRDAPNAQCSNCCGVGYRLQADGCGNTRSAPCRGSSCCCSAQWVDNSTCSECCGTGFKAQNDGCGQLRTVACEEQTCCNGPPSIPRSLAAASGDGTVCLSWEAPLNENGGSVLSYSVTATPTIGGSAARSQPLIIGTDVSTNSVVEGLANGYEYEFRVTATNEFGESEPSRPVRATPSRATGDGTCFALPAPQTFTTQSTPVSVAGSQIPPVLENPFALLISNFAANGSPNLASEEQCAFRWARCGAYTLVVVASFVIDDYAWSLLRRYSLCE